MKKAQESAPVLILMYHRVCAQSANTRAYFTRGTAITPEIFAEQVSWLSERYHFGRLSDLYQKQQNNVSPTQPTCILTFDDGYIDIIKHVIPICEAHNAPICVFPVSNHTGDSKGLLWFDRYYALLHHAKQFPNALNRLLGLSSPHPVQSFKEAPGWWVSGPPKQLIKSLPPDKKDRFLDDLQRLLGVDEGVLTQPFELYLNKSELRNLIASGHEVGGHSATHPRLGELEEDELVKELHESKIFLDGLGVTYPKGFCYPDGNHSESVEKALEQEGFAYACTVKSAHWSLAHRPLVWPRIFIKNTTPENPKWDL